MAAVLQTLGQQRGVSRARFLQKERARFTMAMVASGKMHNQKLVAENVLAFCRR